MKCVNLKQFTKGWIVGSFTPTIIDTTDVEVAVKRYQAGFFESSHHHKVATEITIIVSGEVEMNSIKYTSDDIIVMEPGESTDFRCLTDAICTVIKVPGAKNDKFID